MKYPIYILFAVLFTGCATQAPVAIRHVPEKNVSVDQVRTDIKRYTGTEIRWGGVISDVQNKTNETWIEIVSRRLWKNGQPVKDGKSAGRFIASFKGFADPAVYTIGQSLTVIGTVEGQVVRTIGDYKYTFPIVSVTGSYLWPVEQEVSPYDYPYPYPWWYYDPWPYYPPPWPYYPPYYW